MIPLVTFFSEENRSCTTCFSDPSLVLLQMQFPCTTFKKKFPSLTHMIPLLTHFSVQFPVVLRNVKQRSAKTSNITLNESVQSAKQVFWHASARALFFCIGAKKKNDEVHLKKAKHQSVLHNYHCSVWRLLCPYHQLTLATEIQKSAWWNWMLRLIRALVMRFVLVSAWPISLGVKGKEVFANTQRVRKAAVTRRHPLPQETMHFQGSQKILFFSVCFFAFWGRGRGILVVQWYRGCA